MDSLSRGLATARIKYDAPSKLARSPLPRQAGEGSGRPVTSTIGMVVDAGRGSDGSVCVMVR